MLKHKWSRILCSLILGVGIFMPLLTNFSLAQKQTVSTVSFTVGKEKHKVYVKSVTLKNEKLVVKVASTTDKYPLNDGEALVKAGIFVDGKWIRQAEKEEIYTVVSKENTQKKEEYSAEFNVKKLPEAVFLYAVNKPKTIACFDPQSRKRIPVKNLTSSAVTSPSPVNTALPKPTPTLAPQKEAKKVKIKWDFSIKVENQVYKGVLERVEYEKGTTFLYFSTTKVWHDSEGTYFVIPKLITDRGTRNLQSTICLESFTNDPHRLIYTFDTPEGETAKAVLLAPFDDPENVEKQILIEL